MAQMKLFSASENTRQSFGGCLLNEQEISPVMFISFPHLFYVDIKLDENF